MAWHLEPGRGRLAELQARLPHRSSGTGTGGRVGASTTLDGIRSGDRLFILRQGVEPTGIIASGVVTGPPERDAHWSGEHGRSAYYAPLIFDAIVDAHDRIPAEPHPGRLCAHPWPARRRALDNSTRRNLNPRRCCSSARTVVARALAEAQTGHHPDSSGLGADEIDSAFEGGKVIRYAVHRQRENLLRASRSVRSSRAPAGWPARSLGSDPRKARDGDRGCAG